MNKQTKTKQQPNRQALEKIEQENRLLETRQVAAQPHRRGDGGDMTDALGVFVKHFFQRDERDTGRRCWEAGQKYIRKVARLRRVKGVPQNVLIEDETPSGGGELDMETVAIWIQEIKECENSMKCSGLPGFHAANDLVLDDKPPPEHLYGPVKRAIFHLAICLGFFTDERRK